MKKIKKKLGLNKNPESFTKVHLADAIKKYGYEVGDFSYGKLNLKWHSKGAKLKVGSYCSFGEDITVLLGGNHHMERVTTYPFGAFRKLWSLEAKHAEVHLTKGGVTIGSDVWIADGATILSGINIGHGAVIGTQAVVTKDVPPYAIVAGNPAKIIKKRFDDATIEQLLKLEWWNLPKGKIKQLIPYLLSDDIKKFIAEAKKA